MTGADRVTHARLQPISEAVERGIDALPVLHVRRTFAALTFRAERPLRHFALLCDLIFGQVPPHRIIWADFGNHRHLVVARIKTDVMHGG
jgi:hypothetical protein